MDVAKQIFRVAQLPCTDCMDSFVLWLKSQAVVIKDTQLCFALPRCLYTVTENITVRDVHHRKNIHCKLIVRPRMSGCIPMHKIKQKLSKITPLFDKYRVYDTQNTQFKSWVNHRLDRYTNLTSFTEMMNMVAASYTRTEVQCSSIEVANPGIDPRHLSFLRAAVKDQMRLNKVSALSTDSFIACVCRALAHQTTKYQMLSMFREAKAEVAFPNWLEALIHDRVNLLLE